MKSQNEGATTRQEAVMSELDPSQLTEITGGIILVGDGYCVSPFLPRHLPLVAVQQQEFNGAIAAGSR